jgi:hypothetical protein
MIVNLLLTKHSAAPIYAQNFAMGDLQDSNSVYEWNYIIISNNTPTYLTLTVQKGISWKNKNKSQNKSAAIIHTHHCN